jgi:hypothetical protein
MMPQVAAAAAVTVSRLDQPAQPLRKKPRTIQAKSFSTYTKHNFNTCGIAKQDDFKIFEKFS